MKIDLTQMIKAAEAIKKAKVQATGKIGEFSFDWVAQKYLPDDYRLLSDVVLKYGEGTTQIDQIIVSPYGIFVVEIKTYKGWIYGNQGKWTQVLYGSKNRFQSPITQNVKHINAVQNLLKLPDDMFKILIVFSGEAKFKTTMPDYVVRGAKEYLDYILKWKNVRLDKYAVDEAVKMIDCHRRSNAEHKQHMQKLKEKYDAGDLNSPPYCPRCNRKMVLRTAKRGANKGNQFWGCTNYPGCKFTFDYKNENSIRAKVKTIENTLNMFFG